ncbi:MAG: 2-dehydropantoate 2-reductase [Oscillospiraceae bacterium]|nr:2-dehydropantoate 2-reductase [Oscillospiraceae bacterium]
MRIAIYGAGALGTILGAYLTRAGLDVTLVTRNTAHVAALNQKGAKIIGETEMLQPVKAVLPEDMSDCYDVVFLMTKQSENQATAEFIKTKIKDDGVLCTTQNGLPELKLMEILSPHRVVGTTVIWGASPVEAGVVRLTSNVNNMSFQIGSLAEGSTERLQTIKDILQHMCPVYIEENFLGARWSKLLINAAFSGLSTIFDVTFGKVADNRKMRAIAQRVIKESIDVAKEADIAIMPVQGRNVSRLMDYKRPIKKKIANLIIPIAMKKHKSIRSGMLYDLERGRPTEVDAINGVVCDFGRRYRCATPFNDRIVEIVHQIEAGALVQSPDNIHLFDDLL